MPEARCYPTKYVNLWYRNDGEHQKKAHWVFVDGRTRKTISGPFRDKFDLFAEVDSFAARSGFNELVVIEPNQPHPVPPKEPERPKPAPQFYQLNLTCAEMWKDYWGTIDPQGDAPEANRLIAMEAYFAGLYSMLQVMYRIGEDDIDGEAGVAWTERLRKECVETLRRLRRG